MARKLTRQQLRFLFATVFKKRGGGTRGRKAAAIGGAALAVGAAVGARKFFKGGSVARTLSKGPKAGVSSRQVNSLVKFLKDNKGSHTNNGLTTRLRGKDGFKVEATIINKHPHEVGYITDGKGKVVRAFTSNDKFFVYVGGSIDAPRRTQIANWREFFLAKPRIFFHNHPVRSLPGAPRGYGGGSFSHSDIGFFRQMIAPPKSMFDTLGLSNALRKTIKLNENRAVDSRYTYSLKMKRLVSGGTPFQRREATARVLEKYERDTLLQHQHIDERLLGGGDNLFQRAVAEIRGPQRLTPQRFQDLLNERHEVLRSINSDPVASQYFRYKVTEIETGRDVTNKVLDYSIRRGF